LRVRSLRLSARLPDRGMLVSPRRSSRRCAEDRASRRAGRVGRGAAGSEPCCENGLSRCSLELMPGRFAPYREARMLTGLRGRAMRWRHRELPQCLSEQGAVGNSLSIGRSNPGRSSRGESHRGSTTGRRRAAARLGLRTPSWPGQDGLQPRFAQTAGCPRCESYTCPDPGVRAV